MSELADAADVHRLELGLVGISRWYLKVLQVIVRHWLAHLSSEGNFPDIWQAHDFNRPPSDSVAWSFWQDHMNAALASFPLHLRLSEDDDSHLLHLPEPNLFTVAIAQVAQLINEGHTVRLCANENCKNLFTRQRGRARYTPETAGYDTQKYEGVRYCSHRCAKAQSERDRRARRRAEQEKP